MNNKKEYFDSIMYSATLNKIGPIREGTSSPETRRLVGAFWEKAARYFGVLFSLDAAIESGRIGEETACEIAGRETDAILAEGQALAEEIRDDVVMKSVKRIFRECGLPLGMKSEIIKHAFLKPSGYAGDYGIIEIVYNNRVLSRGSGYIADTMFLKNDYARAVRSRKDSIKSLLARYCAESPARTLEILNIACGSCRELKEMITENKFDGSKKFVFTLVDQDQAALDFSRKALEPSPSTFEFHFLRHSVYDYLKNPDAFGESLGGKDIVYTIGLADYIPEPALKSLIAFFYGLLKPGGWLLIAHKDSKNYVPLAPDWWCDWTFHLRDEPEMIRIAQTSGLENFSLRIEREKDTNIIFFLIIGKG